MKLHLRSKYGDIAVTRSPPFVLQTGISPIRDNMMVGRFRSGFEISFRERRLTNREHLNFISPAMDRGR